MSARKRNDAFDITTAKAHIDTLENHLLDLLDCAEGRLKGDSTEQERFRKLVLIQLYDTCYSGYTDVNIRSYAEDDRVLRFSISTSTNPNTHTLLFSMKLRVFQDGEAEDKGVPMATYEFSLERIGEEWVYQK